MASAEKPDPRDLGKLRIVADGPDGYSTRIFLDDKDISQHVRRVTVDLEAGQINTARLELFLHNIEIDLDKALVNMTETEASREIRQLIAQT